jgi:NADPH-dependent stearoyl-CoA 9-desaturase
MQQVTVRDSESAPAHAARRSSTQSLLGRATTDVEARAPVGTPSVFSSEAERLASFGRALDALKSEVERELGETDAQHILRIGRLSKRLEVAGRTLMHFSFEPVGFSLATAALFVHKALELMEIGHPALHGCYDGLPGAEKYASATFKWKSPIDEASWRREHNMLHHQFTNIEGRDPDLNFGVLRLSGRVPYRLVHALQPISNVVTFFVFGAALNLHATGMIDLYLREGEPQVLPDKKPATKRAAKRAFLSKMARHYGREYGLFPLLAGPFFGKVLLGNLLSEVARDVYAASIIYCGHVGADDYAAGTETPTRAHWYKLQVEGARDVEVPEFVSILCGALDKQIEHHLFPRLPPNRLREIAPRVRAICEQHGVHHRRDSWPRTLWSVLRELTTMAVPSKSSEPATYAQAAE